MEKRIISKELLSTGLNGTLANAVKPLHERTESSSIKDEGDCDVLNQYYVTINEDNEYKKQIHTVNQSFCNWQDKERSSGKSKIPY